MKNVLVVTGGAGFVGSNLTKKLLQNYKYKIISIDNYSSGFIKNHIKSSNVKYINANTTKIKKILEKYRKKIHSIFHFGEFSRIYMSFERFDQCYESNIIGTNEVFQFCLKNKIKLIYSATSASLGNRGKDRNLSPYAYTKAKNLELLENYKKWFGLEYEIIYFYNVYGPGQICKGKMATVIGIFEEKYKKNKPMTVVSPGSQTRRFTHINDTIDVCIEAWKNNKNRHYSISSKKSYSIIQVAKMFSDKVKFLKKRKGERYASALTKINMNNKIYRRLGKTSIKEYIKNFKEKNS